MITVLIAVDNIWQKEQLVSCVLRRVEQSVTLLCPAGSQEAWELIRNEKKHHIDMFIINVKSQPIGGGKLAERIRSLPLYRNTPILFLTDVSYDLVGFSYLSTKHGHRTHNYISLPLDKIDAQGKIGMYLEDIIAAQLDYDEKHRTFLLNHSAGKAALASSDIYFAEVQNKVLSLHTKKGLFHVKRKGLTETVALVRSDSFIRCHKSFALNAACLTSLNRVDKRLFSARFQDYEPECLVSKTYAAQVFSALKKSGKD